MKKRFWAAILALVFCCGCLPQLAMAAPWVERAFDHHYGGSFIQLSQEAAGARGIVTPRPDAPYSPESYFAQLDPVSQAVYTALKESDLFDGPSRSRVTVDLTSLPLESRRTVATLYQTKTGPATGYWHFAGGSDPLACAFMALTYDHPELSWLEQTDFEANVISDFDGVTSFFSSMQVGETRPFQQPLTFFKVEYQLTEKGYAQATTDCDALSSADRFGYADTKDRAVIEAALQNAVRDIGDLEGKPEQVKIRAIHDWVCSHMDYADTDSARFLNDWRGYQTVYSALVDGITVCAGYAKSFKLLCDAYGIPCVLIRGTADGEMHMWNHVRLDDAWYAVDCTWDDQHGSDNAYAYFLKGADGFPNHQEGLLWDDGAPFAYPQLAGPDYSMTAKRETDSFVFFGTDVHKQSLENLEQHFEDCAARVMDHLGVSIQPKTEVHIYPDQSALDKALDVLYGSASVPTGNPAVALPPNQMYMREPEDPSCSEDSIVKEGLHEFVYLALHQLGVRLAPDHYLAMGIARYEDGVDLDRAFIAQAEAAGTLPSLQQLDAGTLDMDAQAVFAEAYVDYIVSSHGWAALVSLLHGESRPDVLGQADEQTNAQWLAYLQQSPREPQLAEGSPWSLVDTDFGTVLTGMDAGHGQSFTSVATVRSQLVGTDARNFVVTSASGKERAAADAIATGDTAELQDAEGNTLWSVTLVVRGDVLGSGRMDITQLVALSQAFLGQKQLDAPYFLAGNLSGSGKLSIADLVAQARLLTARS